MTPDEIARQIVHDSSPSTLVLHIAMAIAAERAAREKAERTLQIYAGDLTTAQLDADREHAARVEAEARAEKAEAERDEWKLRAGNAEPWRLYDRERRRTEKAEAALEDQIRSGREVMDIANAAIAAREKAEAELEIASDLYNAASSRAEKAEAERDEARQEAFNLRAKCGGCIKFDERVDLENRARATALRNAADTARRMHNEYAANAILELIDKEPDANG